MSGHGARRPRLSLVAAVAENGAIGRDGALPWRIADDLAWFKRNTMGKPMVMGRRTFDSIGKALPGRDSIVLSRDAGWRADGVYLTRALPAALRLGGACAHARDVGELCVIGGGELYAQTLDRAERLYLTKVRAQIDGDAYFPALAAENWRADKVGEAHAGPRNEHFCEFFIYDRIS